MTHPARTLRRAAVLAAGASLLLALPAGAHPYFDGGEVPVDSLATLTLDLAHGCDTEAEGEGAPTTDVSLEVPDWLRVVEAEEPDGWVLDLEDADEDEDVLEVVTWTVDGGEEPAPTFDLDVVASGEPGDERYVRVFQACDDTTHRWVGTPDEPAEDPAVGLTLVEADPDSPPPPEEDEDAATDDADAGEEAGQDATTEEEDDADGAQDEATEDDTDEVEDAEEPADDATEDDTADDEELATDDLAVEGEGGVPTWLIVTLVLVLVLGVVAALVLRRQRPAEGA